MKSIELEKILSRELRAILRIVTADEELKRKVLPHIDFDRESINWDEIFSNDFGGGHLSAILFAKAIWCDAVTTKSDPFDRAFAMDARLMRAVIEALAIRWSLIN
jgi:hypothetical protein